ncbi:hypothetical protein BSKO_04098 [Bryopsis sp. KO-2023]|nr:hypothetical protein BSKO_04098 [Bryopsis sp. KO-2023]
MVLHSDGLSSKKMRCEDFELKTVISRGTFGVVYRAIRKEDGKEFALKQVSLAGLGRAEREECIDEARILSQLNHPHIVRHYDSFVDTKEQKLNIFMEYAAGGTIHHLLAKRGKRIDESHCWRYFLQCLLALDHIHSKKIIHRDMKSLNVFLDSNNDVKIGDFGIARSLSNNSNFARTIVGTPFYLSPELCDDKPYNEKSDIWALGQLLAWSGIRSTARRLGLDIDINKKLHLLKRTPTPTPLPPVVHSPKKAVSKQSPEPEIPPALEHVNEENESKRINQNVEGLEGKKGVAPREPHIFDLDCAEESFRRNVYGERPTTTPPDNLGVSLKTRGSREQRSEAGSVHILCRLE